MWGGLLAILPVLARRAGAVRRCDLQLVDQVSVRRAYCLLCVTLQEYYTCPGQDDPPSFTVCCGTGCCPPEETQPSHTVIIILSILVVSLASLLAACLCCRKCPLYQDVQLSRFRKKQTGDYKKTARSKSNVKYTRP